MKISMETKHKILIYLTIIIAALITAYLICMGIKLNKTSNKMAGTVKKEFKDTNVDTLLEGDNANVAKLNMYQNNKEVFVKDIKKIEITNLESIIKRGNRISESYDYQKNPHYTIKLNDTFKANFDINLCDNYIVISYLNENYVIYKENDVNYLIILLNLVDNTNISDIDITKYSTYKEINLEDYNVPFDLYLSFNNKLELSSFNWSKKINTELSSMVSKLVKSPKEILKDKKSIEISNVYTFVSINNKDTKFKLPKETIIKYKFYKEEQGENEVEFVNAERMIDSSYYLKTPDASGEYILEVLISFGELSKNQAIYFTKCKF